MITANEVLNTLNEKLLTVEQVSDLLLKNEFIEKGFKREKSSSHYVDIKGPASAETYGTKTFIYVIVDPSAKKEIINFLKSEGMKIGKYDVKNVIEIPVNYFKARNWDK